MAKRRKEELAKPSKEWMNTFADLMNLLLCFFVLLFSMSTVDAQKFELIAASFSQTFSIFSAGSKAIGDGRLISNGVSQLNQLDQYIYSTGKAAENEEITDQLEQMQKILEQEKLTESEKLAEKIQEAINENQLQNQVEVDFTSQYVQLTLKGAILFDSGSATLKAEAMPTVEKVGLILERYIQNIIEIEGHTDNVPISSSAKYEDNNVLSMYRALSVADYLRAKKKLNPAYVKSSGRGEYVPIADNSTSEGRARNRRVEIKIFNSHNSDVEE